MFIDSFSNSVCADYEENTGSGNVKRAKTEGRLSAIAAAFAEYFGLGVVYILDAQGSNGGVSDSEGGQDTEASPADEDGFGDADVGDADAEAGGDVWDGADSEEDALGDSEGSSEEGDMDEAGCAGWEAHADGHGD